MSILNLFLCFDEISWIYLTLVLILWVYAQKSVPFLVINAFYEGFECFQNVFLSDWKVHIFLGLRIFLLLQCLRHFCKLSILDETFNISWCKVLCLESQLIYKVIIDVSLEIKFFEIDFDNIWPLSKIRESAIHLFINSTWSEKCYIDHIWSSSGCHHKNAISSLNTIQITQKLIYYSICDWCLATATLRNKGIKLIKE